MNQKIFNNVILIIIIIIIIKNITPNKDSTLYILNIYLNYIIDQIKQLLDKLGLYKYIENFENNFNKTFQDIPNFNLKTPIMDDNYTKFFIKGFNKINPNVSIEQIKKLYNFIESLISIDIDNYFLTPSDNKPIIFTNNEKQKIVNILLNKFNSNIYSFTDFKFIKEPVYYNNFSGKEIDPFIFTINCEINKKIKFILQIYIEISIRNDVKRNIEYLVINKIKLLINNTDLINNMYKNKKINDESDLLKNINYNDNDNLFENTNFIHDFFINENKAINTNIANNTDFKNNYLEHNYSENYFDYNNKSNEHELVNNKSNEQLNNSQYYNNKFNEHYNNKSNEYDRFDYTKKINENEQLNSKSNEYLNNKSNEHEHLTIDSKSKEPFNYDTTQYIPYEDVNDYSDFNKVFKNQEINILE